MSPEERQLLVELFQRTNAAAAQPRDRDAEAFIAEAVRLQPFAPYLLAQTVIVQEQALKAAAERLERLEAENRDLQSRAQSGGAQQGGFLGGLFGGGQQPAAPPPPPPPRQNSPWGAPAQQQGAGWGAPPPQPGPQAGPWGGAPQQQAGGGFLKGALGAAAGVAGGMLLADSIRGLFHGPGSNNLGIGSGFGGSGLGTQAGLGGGETIINNYYGDRDSDVRHAAADDGDDDDRSDVSDADWGGDDSGSDDSYDV
ncbi:MAG: DUF2076 domain-containing protein [Beijerinckiaceae bacterium]